MLARLVPSTLVALSLLSGCGGSAQHDPKTAGAAPAASKPASTPDGAAGGGGAEAPADPAAGARDPHEAALLTLLAAPWGARNDKDDTIHAPTPDWERWRRVRYWGVEHFTGFKYRKNHHVVAAVFVQDMPEGTPVRSETCMRRFEQWGRPQIKPFDVKFGPFGVKWAKWHNAPLMISIVDGALNVGLSRVEFSGAWAAYPAYPNACLIYAVAVPWRGHAELAQKLRDRFVEEGFVHMAPRTSDRPYRTEKKK